MIALALLGGPQSYTQVLTRNYNNQRTGATLSETVLSTSTVNSTQFGKLFMLPVDDQVFAGILYVPGVQIAGGTHNVIYVETVNNSVYAFDADTFGPPLWFKNFNGSGQPSNNNQVGQVGCGTGQYNDFRGNIGIVGTPVIDGSSGTIYLVTRTVESGATVQRLRALDITTGNDQPNSPQVIRASVPGIGDGGTTVLFNAPNENQRAALALSQGVVYIAWSSYCDSPPYHGWVIAYNSSTLAQEAAFNVTPNGSMGGIWMGAAGPVFDSNGYIYYSTSNGTTDANAGGIDYAESMVKLQLVPGAQGSPGSLNVTDYFAPCDFVSLNINDLDFGSAGPTLLPGTNTLVSGGKEGKMYVLNTGSLGGTVGGATGQTCGDPQIAQVWQVVDTTIRPTATHHLHNASPAWNSPEGLNLYVWGENDFLHAFRFNTGTQTFTLPAFANGSILPPYGMPGGMMTISANGSQSGSGVLWASVPSNGDANQFTVPGNLYAFNAENLAWLWASTGPGDDLLNFSKGSAPIVANGKVYVGSLSNFVSVYGLKTAGAINQDLALNQTATGSTPCTSTETPDKAFNGTVSGGLDDKWCSTVTNPFLMVDLGSTYNVSRFVVEHAGAGGESFNLNTAAFNIQISTDGVNFTTVVNVTNNIASITTNDITPTPARYVQLNVIGGPASIYEFQVFSPQLTPDFSLSVSPSGASAVAGTAAGYTATVAPVLGFSGSVALSASGLPSGASAAFLPTSVTGSGSSALTISTASSTPAGVYTVSISGTSGSLSHSASVSLTITAPCTYSLSASSASYDAGAASGSVDVVAGAGCAWTVTNPQPGWLTITSGSSGSGNGVVNYSLSASTSASSRSATLTVAGLPYTVTQAASSNPALGFFPISPCRAVDTRSTQGKTGPYGPPSLLGYTKRDFPISSSGCGIPSTVQAYSLNMTAVPPGPLDFLSTWPAGQSYPGVSTLNSPGGSTIANAALVPSGTNGAITVTAGNPTDLIIDTNGYFGVPNGSELVFYPVTPCRAVDTRQGQNKTGDFGPPSLIGNVTRNFPIPSSGCGIPATAQAYSLNMTVVPQGSLDFLSSWPAGQGYPGVSTLNSPDGNTIANAAIVLAGASGAITVLAADPADLIIDVNGYFAPPGNPGALHFYPLTPCRVVDTRVGQNKTGDFGPPSLAGYSARNFPILSGACGVPATAQAYSLNMTVVPQGPLDFLSAWPTGQPYPGVSTLNSPDGDTIANAAIVVAGTNGAIRVVAGNPTDLIIDINGYFAP